MAKIELEALEEAMLGRWRTVKTEGMEQLREVFSLDADTVPNNPRCELHITKDREGVYTVVNKTRWGTKTSQVVLGQPLKDTVMGREIDLVMAWEGRQLVTREVGSEESMVTREVVDGRLVCTVRINGFLITSLSERY